jgi:hypothetical protein
MNLKTNIKIRFFRCLLSHSFYRFAFIIMAIRDLIPSGNCFYLIFFLIELFSEYIRDPTFRSFKPFVSKKNQKNFFLFLFTLKKRNRIKFLFISICLSIILKSFMIDSAVKGELSSYTMNIII